VTPRRQLALPFPHVPPYHTAAFCGGPSNAAATAWLERTGDWPGGRLAIWGAAGRGKTHLLHRWAHRQGALLIDGPVLRGLAAPPLRAVAVDDADAAAEETALLHLLNAAAEAGAPVLLAGRTPPARWPVRLPDLASRLRAITAVELGRPEDALLRALLRRLLADRQVAVPEAVQEWLLLRLPRSAGAVREAACRLDRAALAAGGPVSRALAAAVLAEMQSDGDDVLASPDAPPSPDLAVLF
jgi:chromosomal replication initiation ATPase DnaA